MNFGQAALGAVRPLVGRALALAGSRPSSVDADLAMISNPNGRTAEAIQTLAQRLARQHLGAGRRALAVSSPSAKSGCTTVSAELAVALGQMGVKTLLVEADLRAPGLASLIQPSRGVPGLLHALSDQGADLQACIQPYALAPALSVLHAGGVVDDALDRLSSPRFEALVTECLRNYEFTLFDTPPADRCADPLRIGSLVGYSLIVARRSWTMVEDVRTLARELARDGVEVVGTVLSTR